MHSKVLKMPYKTKIKYGADKYALLTHFQGLHTIRYVFKREK